MILALMIPGTGFAEPSEGSETADTIVVETEVQQNEDQESETAVLPEEDETVDAMQDEDSEENPDNVDAGTEEETGEEEEQEKQVPVYRLYNPKTTEHLFTTSLHETTVLYQQHGWNWEGIGWYAPEQGKAVYRLFNKNLNQHIFTTDTHEKKVLSTQHGWTIDNNDKPLFYSGGDLNVYRLYLKSIGAHHLTLDKNEYDKLPEYGWKQEGTAFKALAKGRIPGDKAEVSGNLSTSGVNGTNGTFKVTGSEIISEIGIKKVEFAIWRDSDQNDIKWYTASGSGSTYNTTAKVSNHKHHFGTYTIHMYVTLGNGVRKNVASTTFKINADNYVYGAYANSDQSKYTITILNANIGGEAVDRIKAAVWSSTGGQDDLVWYNMTNIAGKNWHVTVDQAKHKHAGAFNAHLYGNAGESEAVIRKHTFTLKEALTEVEKLAEARLNAVGRNLRAAFNWSVRMRYQSLDTRKIRDCAAMATYGFKNGKGNCGAMAATFYYMAKRLGYDAHYVTGYVPLAGGGMGPHAWVEITEGGRNWVYDPDFNHETGRNGFKIYYGYGGTWRYSAYSRVN